MSDWITDYYADVDGMRLEPYVAHHSEDAVVVFANNPPAVGRAAIGEAIGGFWSMIGGLRHEVHNRWDVNDGATAILEVTTHYTTHGGAAVPLRCVSILDRNAEGEVTSLRVHIDLAPLFAAIASESEPQGAAAAP
ncbi:nuclear transport factor 2 family protein [Pseudonocardia sp.]|uniref:nuclear transport factor 2 family protein n=1 Tax=Pseudonocardia sp. TaxID=60912 RepID=UPI00261334E8|nr:nuclear transport factor 2 family protein [Pseudonocardia sp.]